MTESNLGSLRVSLGLDTAQFTQSMGDINRQMKVARSAFEAASDGTKDYAKSLEGLRAKSELLTRQTELQRAKVEDLRRRYEESKRTVGENAAATDNLLIAYNRARGGLNRFESQLREVNDAFDDQRDSSKKAREALQGYADKGKDVGEKLSTTLTPALAGISLGLIKVASDAEGSSNRIQAVLGITAENAQKLGDKARDSWEKGFGENVEDVEKGLLSVKQNMKGLNDEDLQQATENAMNLAGVFEADVNEVTRAGSNLMKGFGIDSGKAFDLMAWGGQKGLNFSQEMFDNLSEYSPLYKKMGFSAEDYFQLLQKGSESGVYNLDYINDSMKEFQIRTKDGSKATTEAMGQMSKSTQGVFKNFQNGKATVKELHNAVIKDLSGMDDQTKANGLGVSLYGTKWEDLEADSMYALGNIDGAIKDVDGAMKRSGDNVDKTFGEKLQVAWRTAQADLLPLGEILLKVAEQWLPKITGAVGKVTEAFSEMSPTMQNVVLGVGAFAAVMGPAILAISSVVGAIASSSLAVGGFAGALALLTNPVGIAVGIIAGLGLGYLALDKAMDKPIIKSDIFKGKVSEDTEKILGSFTKLKNDSEVALNEMAWSNEAITQTHVDNMVAKYQQMTDTILKQLDTRHQKEKIKMMEFFAGSDALTEEEEAHVLAEMDKTNEEKKGKIVGYNEEERKIIQESFDQHGKITDKARITVNAIETTKYKEMIGASVKNKEEQETILTNLKNNSEIISAEKAAKVVGNSKKETDKSIEEANKKYNETVTMAEYERDVTGSLSGEKADKIIKNAKKTKDESVTHAKTMHDDVVGEANKQAGEHADEINWETGQVLSGWDSMYNGVLEISNWIRGIFGLKQEKKRGSYSESGRQKNKRQNASFAAYANGTPSGTHAGGMALVGEEGAELAHIPNQGLTMLGVGGQHLVDLPQGSSVLPHRHTKQVMKQYGIPMYANGIGDYFDTFMKGSKAVWDLGVQKFNVSNNVFPDWFSNMGDFTGGIGGWAKDSIKKIIDEGFGSGGSWAGGTAKNSQVEAWVRQALSITGTSLSWLPAMMVKAQKESGFNPRAINLWDSNFRAGHPSKGLFQTIDSTFNAHKMSGMNDIWNPLHNTVAAIRYIKSRYGSVFNTPGMKSMAKGGAYKGYATGGEINNHQFAELGENGWKEWVITSEPKYRKNNIEMWKKAGDSLGVSGGGSTSNTSNTYNINVAYSGSSNGSDARSLVKMIKEEIERQDEQSSRSLGVIY